MKQVLLKNWFGKASLLGVMLIAASQSLNADVLWNGEKAFTDYAGLEIDKEKFSTVAEGDVITMTITAFGENDAKFAFKQKDNGWNELTGFEWVNVTEAYKYEYTVTETTAAELAAYGLVIQGNNITVTEVALIDNTPEPEQTSFVLSTSEWTAGNWSSNGQVSIGDITANTTIEDGDVLRIYVTDFDTENVTPSISLSYTKGDNWSWADFETSYQYYNPATTTAYVDFQITGELLTTLTADDTKSVLIRGSYYTGTKVEYIKADGYYVNLSDQYTAEYIAGTANVNITRSLLAGFNTITLPFAATAEELTGSAEAYLAQLSGVNTDEGTVLTFTKVAETEANKPYIIYVENDVDVLPQEDKTVSELVDDWRNRTWGGDFCMQGNYMPSKSVYQVDSKNCYVVSDADAIAPTGSTATLNGMRAYFFDNNSSAGVKANITFSIDGAVTAIESIDGMPTSSAVYYNLAGQRIQKPQRGIYIVNGKKVVIK